MTLTYELDPHSVKFNHSAEPPLKAASVLNKISFSFQFQFQFQNI